jgi:hypothetical protein
MLRARVVAPHLHPAAAALHAAPAPGAVSAVVVEEPPAVVAAGAFPNPREVALGEELVGGRDDRPQDAAQVALARPRPAEAAIRTDERRGSDRVEILVLDRPQRAAGRLAAACDRAEDRVDRGAQSDRPLEDGTGAVEIRLGELEQLARGPLVERLGVPAPADEVGVVVQEVVRLAERIFDRVGEMQTEPAAEQAWEVLDRPLLGNGAILPAKACLRSKRSGYGPFDRGREASG